MAKLTLNYGFSKVFIQKIWPINENCKVLLLNLAVKYLFLETSPFDLLICTNLAQQTKWKNKKIKTNFENVTHPYKMPINYEHQVKVQNKLEFQYPLKYILIDWHNI